MNTNMETEKLQRTKSYTIDLTKTQGTGEFRCPKCGTEISPDDQTEHAYTILKTVTKKDCLERLILKCKACGSHIHLTGFDSLDL